MKRSPPVTVIDNVKYILSDVDKFGNTDVKLFENI